MRSSLRAADYDLMLDLTAALLESQSLLACRQQITAQLNYCLRGQIAVFGSGLHPTVPDQARAIAVAPNRLEQFGNRAELRRSHVANPLVEHFVLTGDRQARAQQDVLDVRRWRATATYTLVRERTGATDHLVVPIPSHNPGLTAVWLARDARFRDRDLEFCRRVVPLIVRVDRHFAVLATTLPASPGNTVTVPAGITTRELTVLALLADGLTAAAIGRRLGISTHTVTKHQSNLYRKFGTRDRLTTVLEAQQCGLLPPRPPGHKAKGSSP